MSRRTRPLHRRPANRGQIAVGLVGVGPMWERRYRAAAERLSERLSIRVVYDAVLAKAQIAAAELGADAASGLRQVFERQDVQAVLVLDPAWYDLFPAELACLHHKPTFLAGSLGGDLAALESLHRLAADRHTLLMTEFSRRYTPATNRLRELIATRLGAARQVTVDAILPQAQSHGPLPGQDCERDYLAGLFDWCQYITGRVPTTLSVTMLPTPHDIADRNGQRPWQVDLGFRSDSAGHPATAARLRLQPSMGCDSPAIAEGEEAWPFPLHDVLCEHGRAVISDAGEIRWQNGTQVDLGTEKLVSDRSDAEVVLDQFSRRVLGGLVPVADVQDVCRALSLVIAAEQYRQAQAEPHRDSGV